MSTQNYPTQNFEEIIKIIDSLAKGDLTVNIPKSNSDDNFGEILSSLGNLATNWNKTMSQLQTKVKVISKKSYELQSVANQLNTSYKQLSKNISSTSQSKPVEEILNQINLSQKRLVSALVFLADGTGDDLDIALHDGKKSNNKQSSQKDSDDKNTQNEFDNSDQEFDAVTDSSDEDTVEING